MLKKRNQNSSLDVEKAKSKFITGQIVLFWTLTVLDFIFYCQLLSSVQTKTNNALWQSCNMSEKSIKKSVQLWKLISLSIFTENVSIFAWRFLNSSRMRRWKKIKKIDMPRAIKKQKMWRGCFSQSRLVSI